MFEVPLVSIVMSVFNGERFLREAVESILSQTYLDFEFIIVDDGSTDTSSLILAEYKQRDTRVRLCHQENSGAADAWNRGCGLARGKYIARMDADDIALLDRLTRQVFYMEQHDDVGVLGGLVEYTNPDGRSLGMRWPLPTDDAEIRTRLVHGCAFCHPTVMMRKDLFFSVGGYRRIFADTADYDLWVRMAHRCKLANLPECVLKYRIHPDQVSCRKVQQQSLRILAVQAADSLTRTGQADPLDHVTEITPELVAAMGVSEAAQQRSLADQYLAWISNMLVASQPSDALRVALEMLQSSRWHYADKRVIAEAWLTVAKIYWEQDRLLRSCLAAGRAFKTRPFLVGRPIKRWLGGATKVLNFR